MATPTYTPIISYTIPSNTTSVTLGSGGQGTIPSTYTDLVLVANFGSTSSSSQSQYRINGATSGYSNTTLSGNGSSATSGRVTGDTVLYLNKAAYASTNIGTTAIINFQNYANTSTYKTMLSRYGTAANEVTAGVQLWQSTSAITSITFLFDTGSILAGSTFTLYGIANAQIGAPKATGGIITYDSTYYYHTFGLSGTFTPQQSLTADILVVAGGGGGGSGGGGAGGLLGFASQSLTTTGYTVTVGSGGAGASTGVAASNGGDSQFGALTLVKGGGRGSYPTSNVAGSQGSGGGGAAYTGSTYQAAGTATSGQGNNGGSAQTGGGYYASAGGGGAGAVGGDGNNSVGAGAGGAGSTAYSSWGLVTGTGQNVSGTVYYAGGGGGGADTNPAAGGYGGGGAGSNASSTSGLVNTGGGGGGSSNGPTFGKGGSGVVIIRYAKA